MLTVERNRRTRMTGRPFETLLFQTFLPQRESVLFPVQYLEFVAATIDKHEHCGLKGFEFKRLFDQQREPLDGLSKIDRFNTQIDRWKPRIGAHHEA